MIHAHVYMYMTTAKNEAIYFAMEHKPDLERCLRIHHWIVYMKNGDEHHFMSWAKYEKWCVGREYYIDGKLFVSGYQAEEGDTDAD